MITIHNRQLASLFFLDRKKTTSGINISEQRKKKSRKIQPAAYFAYEK